MPKDYNFRPLEHTVIKLVEEQEGQTIALSDVRSKLIKFTPTKINDAVDRLKFKGLISVDNGRIHRTEKAYAQ